jgi:hypothetical protein
MNWYVRSKVMGLPVWAPKGYLSPRMMICQELQGKMVLGSFIEPAAFGEIPEIAVQEICDLAMQNRGRRPELAIAGQLPT